MTKILKTTTIIMLYFSLCCYGNIPSDTCLFLNNLHIKNMIIYEKNLFFKNFIPKLEIQYKITTGFKNNFYIGFILAWDLEQRYSNTDRESLFNMTKWLSNQCSYGSNSENLFKD